MEALKLFDQRQNTTWDYDNEADVLYISFGEPREALGIDIGEGLIVRYDESGKMIAGITVQGVGGGLIKALKLMEKAA